MVDQQRRSAWEVAQAHGLRADQAFKRRLYREGRLNREVGAGTLLLVHITESGKNSEHEGQVADLIILCTAC